VPQVAVSAETRKEEDSRRSSGVAKKRNSGEGSIFRRSDGRWCAQLDLGWQNGRRARKYIYGATAQEVQATLLKARADHSQGLPVAPGRQTVEQFLRDWLENTVKPSVRPTTYRSYEQTVRNHLIPELGRLPLSKLEPQSIRAMLNRRLTRGTLSARSVAYLRVVLRAALNQARKWNLVARNVAELVESPKCERFRIEPLSPDGAGTLLDMAKGDRLEALYAVALACGLRMGEILGLRWKEVDFENVRMTVSQALQRQKGRGLVLTETKTDRSRRTVGLPPPLVTRTPDPSRASARGTACGGFTLERSRLCLRVAPRHRAGTQESASRVQADAKSRRLAGHSVS
jgi:integrase